MDLADIADEPGPAELFGATAAHIYEARTTSSLGDTGQHLEPVDELPDLEPDAPPSGDDSGWRDADTVGRRLPRLALKYK